MTGISAGSGGWCCTLVLRSAVEVNYPWRTRSLTTLTTLMVSGLILLMLRPLSLEHEYELRRSHENVEGKYLETIARRSELSRRPSHRKRSAPHKSGGRGTSTFRSSVPLGCSILHEIKNKREFQSLSWDFVTTNFCLCIGGQYKKLSDEYMKEMEKCYHNEAYDSIWLTFLGGGGGVDKMHFTRNKDGEEENITVGSSIPIPPLKPFAEHMRPMFNLDNAEEDSDFEEENEIIRNRMQQRHDGRAI